MSTRQDTHFLSHNPSIDNSSHTCATYTILAFVQAGDYAACSMLLLQQSWQIVLDLDGARATAVVCQLELLSGVKLHF
jgi:hypothetical protein